MKATCPLEVDTSPDVGCSSPATSESSVDLPQPEAPMRQVNSPGDTSSDTWSSARTAELPRPNTLDTPVSRTDAFTAPTGGAAWRSVTVTRFTCPLGTDLRFAGRGQRRVERTQIEDPAQVDWLEQAERYGLRGVARQRGRVRVVGEGDLLEGRRDDARLERLAGVGAQLRVRVRLGGGGAGLDEGIGLDLRLEQVRNDRGVRGQEALCYDEQGGDTGLAEQHRAPVFDHLDVVGRGLGTAVDLPGLELEHGGRVGRRRLDEGVPAAGRGGRQAVLLKPVAQRDVLRVAEGRGVQRLALELGGGGDALRDDDRGA